MADYQYRPHTGQQYPLIRSSQEYDSQPRVMLREDDQYSLYDSLKPGQNIGASSLLDEKINLVQESFPNYARMDHFAALDQSRMSTQRQKQQDQRNQREHNIPDLQQIQEQPVKQPEFHEQLKRLREEIAHEYEEKLNANLKEIEEYKKQLEAAMKENDQKQINTFQKQVSDKEKQLYHLNAEKVDLDCQLKQQERLVQEKEEIILNYKQNYDQQNLEKERILQKLKEYESKEQAIQNYCENIKKNNDDLKIQNVELVQQLNELKKQDWSKQILELKKENQFLREELQQKQKESNDMQQNLSMAMQTAASGSLANHFTNLLETQSKDIVRMKRLIEEYEKKEKQCSRKWNSLLQENLSLQEKVNAQKQQLQRQKEQYQGIISQIERKVIEANQRLAFVQQTDDKRAAAKYLVHQLKVASDEKLGLISDNENLHLRLQDLQDEYSKLANDCQAFLALKTGQTTGNYGIHDIHIQNQQKLLMKIEELEDLIVELKSQQNQNEIVELKQLLLSKEQEIHILVTRVEEFKRQRVGFKNLFENNELYESFQKVIGERNNIINNLKRELNSIKNQDFLTRMNQPTMSQQMLSNQHYQESPKIESGEMMIKPLNDNIKGNSWAEERDKWILHHSNLNKNNDAQW